MHYLECIELLNYLLSKLYVGQRVQVPVQVLDEVRQQLTAVNSRVAKENNAAIKAPLNDLMTAVFTLDVTKGMKNLTDSIRTTLCDGITQLRNAICLQAYSYFSVHEFTVSEPIKHAMRTVVEVALKEGVLQC